ncbi:MAG: DUF4373 domain-containing protein [Defluviitaleaceae bacterium]|nr:DUF4373 domain-containing protein [Defluviitaleaceae bacterium]
MLLKNKFGFEAISVYLALLCDIYGGEGYYLEFGDEDAFILAERIGGGCKGDFVAKVVKYCMEKELFDKSVYEEHGILTSRGIQERFLRICAKRDLVCLIEEYVVISVDNIKIVPKSIQKKVHYETISSAGNRISGTGNDEKGTGSTQSKVKKSKVNESKSSSSSKKAGTATTKTNSRAAEINGLLPNSVDCVTRERMCVVLTKWLDVFPAETIKLAIDTSMDYNKFNLAYICTVLKDWMENGVKNGKKYISVGKNMRVSTWNSKFPQFESHDYDYEKIGRLIEEKANEYLAVT